MWHLVTWVSGQLVSVMPAVAQDDLKGFSQYKKVNGEASYSKIDSNVIHLEELKAFLGYLTTR